MVRPRPRRRQSIVWTPFAGGYVSPFYESKNFFRMIMLALLLAAYFGLRSWWTYVPVKTLKQREFFDSQGVRRIKKLDPSVESRFMSSILQKPAPVPKSGVKLMDSFVASKLVAAEKSRYRQIKSLEFCDILNGAVVDTFAPLHLPLSFASTDSIEERIAKLVDGTASQTYKDIFDYYADGNHIEAKRYACYAALEASNPNTNLSVSQYLVKVPAKQYFSKILPSMDPSSSSASPPLMAGGKKKKYKIAYLIMMQELHGIHQLKLLLEMLNDSHGIFLIHVPKNDDNLYTLVQAYLRELPKDKNDPDGNVFMTKSRFTHAQGHINQVFMQLAAFWELCDLADWDYVINLSNYDWPLRHNQDIYKLLIQNPGFSYIDVIQDTSSNMARRLRPHLGDKLGKKNVHPPELGIGRWPFPNSPLLFSSQFMILTRAAVEFLRVDDFAFNLLAFLEHCYNPEEIFFSTVLGNSPLQQSLIITEKKRYSRDISNGLWIGWKDKDLFPPGSSDPSYLFFRPFNALGDFFGEGKLRDWVKTNHLDRSLVSQCVQAELGIKDECIQDIASGFASDGELIVIPVVKGFEDLAFNLRCSLNRVGIDNILHWSFDEETHKALVEQELLSYYDPKYPKIPDISNLHSNDALMSTFMRNRPHLTLKLLSAGFNLWFLDPDTVATRDFRDRALKYTSEPFNADMIFSIAESKLVKSTGGNDKLVSPPTQDIGGMYIRNSERSIEFFTSVVDILDGDGTLNGREGMRQAMLPGQVLWTGIGSKSRTVVYGDKVLSGKGGEEEDSKVQGPSKEESGNFMNNLVDFFNKYATEDEANKKIRVHYFDQFEFINGRIIFKKPDLIPEDFSGFRLIHADVEAKAQQAFSIYKLWFLDDNLQCKDSIAIPKNTAK